ncbi:MAG: hypothetical protein KatS3mg102_0250 [Planctomycetota bacterium]|nr:MAG: hypothetical protein KatS3mg102_0250 [Planctomycetota bacterium]
MVVGSCELRLLVRGARSLKDKRRAARSIKDRISALFKVAIAEVADQDKLQSLVLGVAAVGNDGRHVVEVLDKVVAKIRDNPYAELIDHRIELYR